jgi:drug/metabolite transporter (DMT)-like permease
VTEETTIKTEAREPALGFELVLLLLLATLWGGSYTFIKLGVATIPPITLIAGRTLIAGLLLLVIMRWRGVRLPKDAATWRRFMFQAGLNSVVPWTLIRTSHPGASSSAWSPAWRESA